MFSKVSSAQMGIFFVLLFCRNVHQLKDGDSSLTTFCQRACRTCRTCRTYSHQVGCVKPHSTKVPSVFQETFVSNGGRVHLLTHLIHQGVTQCKKNATGIQPKSTQPKKKRFLRWATFFCLLVCIPLSTSGLIPHDFCPCIGPFSAAKLSSSEWI